MSPPIGGVRAGYISGQRDAIPDSVVDHFEETLYEDQSLTLSDYYNGDLSQYSRQQTTVSEGSYALEGTSSGSLSVIVAPAGVNQSLEQGETLRCALRSDNGAHVAGVIFGAQDIDNYYLAQLNFSTNEIELFLKSGGTFSKLTNASVSSAAAGVFYETEVDWQTDGSIIFTLYDDANNSVGSVSVTDTLYSSGGLGFLINPAGVSDSYQFDNYRIV